MPKINKFSNYILVFAIFLAIFIWSTALNNVSADIEPNSAKISFLDVGQGDAALISLPESKQILIDTGKSGKLVDKLNSKMPAFDREIEAVFLTHPDNDHTGSFENLVKDYKVDKVYYSWEGSKSESGKKVDELVEERKISKITPAIGDNYYFSNLRLEVLWPPEKSGFSDNNSSLVMRADLDGSRALFTGDVEIKGQEAMMRSAIDVSADLLKVSHHGSSGAYNEYFLKKVGAKNAVISVGQNSYGHPGKIVLEGLRGLGISVFRTDEKGTVDFVPSEKGWVKR